MKLTGKIWGFDRSNNTITIKCDEDITGLSINENVTLIQDEQEINDDYESRLLRSQAERSKWIISYGKDENGG